jgi:hypothetical protein
MSLCETRICVTRQKFPEDNLILLHHIILLQMNQNIYFRPIKTLNPAPLEPEMFAFY